MKYTRIHCELSLHQMQLNVIFSRTQNIQVFGSLSSFCCQIDLDRYPKWLKVIKFAFIVFALDAICCLRSVIGNSMLLNDYLPLLTQSLTRHQHSFWCFGAVYEMRRCLIHAHLDELQMLDICSLVL